MRPSPLQARSRQSPSTAPPNRTPLGQQQQQPIQKPSLNDSELNQRLTSLVHSGHSLRDDDDDFDEGHVRYGQTREQQKYERENNNTISIVLRSTALRIDRT
jgi:hypothetical protein